MTLNILADSDEELGYALERRYTVKTTLAIDCPHCGVKPVETADDLRLLMTVTPLSGITCLECAEEAHAMVGGLRVGGTRGAYDVVRTLAREALLQMTVRP